MFVTPTPVEADEVITIHVHHCKWLVKRLRRRTGCVGVTEENLKPQFI